MKSIIIIILISVSSLCGIRAQTPEIDSLESKLADAGTGIDQIKFLSKLTWKLRDSDLKKALNYGIRSLKLIAKFNHQKVAAQTNNYVGVIYRNLNEYSNAITYYYRALKAAQANKQAIQVAYAYNNIGEIFKFQNRLLDAEKNTMDAIVMFQKIGNKGGEAYAHLRLGEILQKQQRYEAAFAAYNNAVEIRENLPKQPRLDVVFNRIGSLFIDQEKYGVALTYLRRAEHTNLRNKVQGKGIYSIKVNIAKVFMYQNELNKAIRIAKTTYKEAKKIPSQPLIATSLDLLSQAYALKKEHTKAYKYQREFIKITQEFVNIQNRYKVSVLESIHQLEQKQSEIEIKSKDLELLKQEREETLLRRKLLYALAGMVLLLLGFLFMLIYSNRSKQKANTLLQVKNEQIDSKNQDITASITYAQRIQQALLYLEDNVQNTMPEYFVLFRPRDIVSGDFYWIEEDEGKIFMVAADCTGHGVPGAFMTMLGSQALSNIMIQNKVHKPDQVLRQLDIILRRTLKSKDTLIRDGMDITLVVIDPVKQEMQYAGAKNPLILVQNNEVKEIKGDIFSINGHRQAENPMIKPAYNPDSRLQTNKTREEEDITFVTHTIDISVPTTFYLYSDGYQDQFGGSKGQKFMKKRFRELLFSISEKPIEEQKQTLETTLDDWQGTQEQVDDILVMGAEIVPVTRSKQPG